MHSGEMLPSRRRRIPSTRAHVLYTLETWSFHVSVLLNISPGCLCVLTWGMGTPFIRTSGLCFAVLPIARCLLLGGAKEHAPSFSPWGCCVEIRTKTCTAWCAGLIGSVQCCIISKDRTLALGGLGKIVNKNQEEHWSKDRALWYPWLWGQWCRCCVVQKNTLFSVREEAGEPFSGRWAKSYQGKFAQQSWNRYPIISFRSTNSCVRCFNFCPWT